VHRIVRAGVRPLVATPVRPNHLTTLRIVTGVTAAACFATGQDGWVLAGAAVMVLSLFLDRADGELARLSGKTSRFGHVYDLIADGTANTAVFLGIGLGLRASALADWAVTLGLFAGLAVALSELLVMRLDATGVRKSSELGGRWGFDPDDGLFLVPLGMALGLGPELLIAAAIGAPLACLVLAGLLLAGRRAARS
jgi:phosphatidylglycerophosphate synthase